MKLLILVLSGVNLLVDAIFNLLCVIGHIALGLFMCALAISMILIFTYLFPAILISIWETGPGHGIITHNGHIWGIYASIGVFIIGIICWVHEALPKLIKSLKAKEKEICK